MTEMVEILRQEYRNIESLLRVLELQRETVVLPPKKPPIPDSTEAVRPEGTDFRPLDSRLTVRQT